MRMFSVGCTTDSHQLYATFMSRLSHCIFMWDQDDLTALKKAKCAELEAYCKPSSEADVLRHISHSELALHCRRTTRGTKETLTMIESHIQAFNGDAGRDTLGVLLINSDRMREILKSKRKHVACIQDPLGVPLYTQTGTLVKGGHRLPTYHCARGSTWLESFHLHLNRFIRGTLASDTFFQAYLLDGLARWNEDRAVAATTDVQQPHSYNHLLRHAVNTLAEEVMGKKIIPYVGPRKCFVGAHSPAQWPDCNRVVEAIFTRLCALYSNAVRCDGVRVSRFTMVARAYRHIRECILTNAKVMSETTIQLPEVNAATVTQWFSRRCKSQEQGILKQGIQSPDAPMAAPEKLPAAMQKEPTLYSGNLAEPHLFILPPNTAGEAKLKGRSQPQAISQAPPVMVLPHLVLDFLVLRQSHDKVFGYVWRETYYCPFDKSMHSLQCLVISPAPLVSCIVSRPCLMFPTCPCSLSFVCLPL
ncbi:hypothetical protein IRJ41_008666 [Triplophysa rosa]|uniref:Uncharacterized protein n=1 Tax=Triplophysa rosa TaxID=992332 RepID=A0A9W7T4T5_TRIRA|nr:hypothetical protein IRJ41_008666 [Triplophysa rosa]